MLQKREGTCPKVTQNLAGTGQAPVCFFLYYTISPSNGQSLPSTYVQPGSPQTPGPYILPSLTSPLSYLKTSNPNIQ